MNTDENYYGFIQSTEYYNLIPKASMVYYFNENMYAGILIDVHPDKLEIVRRVYTLSGWLGEVGGF